MFYLDQYYEYGGSLSTNERGLTIGGYESAWLADLVASQLLDNAENLFKYTSKHYGIYRYGGVVFFEGDWSNNGVTTWIQTFQLRVNDLTESEGLQFTAKIGGQTQMPKTKTSP